MRRVWPVKCNEEGVACKMVMRRVWPVKCNAKSHNGRKNGIGNHNGRGAWQLSPEHM